MEDWDEPMGTIGEALEVLRRGFLMDGEEAIIIKDGWEVHIKNDGEELSCTVSKHIVKEGEKNRDMC